MKRVLFFLIATFSVTMFTHAQSHSHLDRIPSKGYAAMDKNGKFVAYQFDRHSVGDNDILIETLYAGICHSDLHTVWSEWGPANYPIVPGHEIAGKVVQVGKNVKKFKVGDYAGVGCMVNSCSTCAHCIKGEEQYCDNGKTIFTYDSRDPYHNDEVTKGGYSNNIVLSEKFAIKIPNNANMEKVAPLLCAGITTYSPLKFTHVGKGDKVAVAGFGGLGHMALQYAVSMGAEVTVFDITEAKRAAAMELGAIKYVNVNDADQLKGLDNSFRVILSTIPTSFDVAMYARMLTVDGEMVLIGMPANDKFPSVNVAFLGGRRKLYGTLIGGIAETQEMLDYSVKHNIYPRIEMIKADGDTITNAYQNVLNGKVMFRYVIDMKTMK